MVGISKEIHNYFSLCGLACCGRFLLTLSEARPTEQPGDFTYRRRR